MYQTICLYMKIRSCDMPMEYSIGKSQERTTGKNYAEQFPWMIKILTFLTGGRQGRMGALHTVMKHILDTPV